MNLYELNKLRPGTKVRISDDAFILLSSLNGCDAKYISHQINNKGRVLMNVMVGGHIFYVFGDKVKVLR